MKIKIEKGIAIPETRGVGLSAALRELKIGDSFVYESSKRSSIPNLSTKLGIKIVSRLCSPTEVRIWRVE